MTRPDAGRVLRRALVAWGLGHLDLGLTGVGRALLVAEIAGIALVAWLTAGLADTSAYLVPYLAGVAFLAAWGWQAVDAYRRARGGESGVETAPARSPAVAIGWLSLPMLLWTTGFWLVAAGAASPSATLDRFVTAWTTGALDAGTWGRAVVREASAAAETLGSEPDRFRDVRVRIVHHGPGEAAAIAEAVHFERRDARFLGLFAGSELVPVADRELLRIELESEEAGLPGGGSIGAVRWTISGADAGP